MKHLFTSILVAISATSASAGGLRQGRNLNQVFPPYSQQCRDDAGPPFQDDAGTFGGKKYHEGKPATAVGNCPNPVKGACRQKSKTAAFLEGPIDCGGRGWFCRILEEPGWPALALTSDVNFGYCNTTQGFEDPGWDRSGHCHGSDSDDTFYWWVRDHWFRGYNGRLRCCCGWEDQVKAGKVVNRCDHRRLVTRDEDLSKCRDANEEGVSPYNGGCATNGDSPTIGEPIPEDDAMCWEVSKFGEPDDGNGGGSNDEDEDDNEDSGDGSGSNDEDDNEDSGDGSGSNDEDDNESCGEDDSNFLFKGRRNKGCNWVGQTKKRAERLCPKMSEGKKVSESCPATCGTCSNNDEDEDDCGEDDSNFLFKGRKNKGCDWVGKVTKRAERLCPMMSEGKKVSESCPVACGICSNDEEDEQEGSGSEDQDEEEGSGSEDQDEEEGSGSEDQDEEEGTGSEDQDEEEGSGSEDQDEEEGSGSEDQDEEEGSGSEDQDEEEGSGSEDQDEEEGSSDQEEEDRL